MDRRSPLLIAGLAATGCGQVDSSVIDARIDADPGSVSLQFKRYSIGASITEAPQSLVDLEARYLVEDPADPSGFSPVPAPLVGDDTWAAEIPTGTPPIQFELPDFPVHFPHIWAFPNRNVLGLFAFLEHPSYVAAPTGVTIDFSPISLGTAYAGEALSLYVVGPWVERAFTGGDLPATSATSWDPPAFAYATPTVTALTGRPLDLITTDDAILILRRVGNQLTGVVNTALDMQPGANAVSGTMVPAVLNQTLDVHVDPTDPAQRFATVRPAMTSGPSFNWDLRAAPGYMIGDNNGPLLHGGAILIDGSGDISVAYGNPFDLRGWKTMFSFQTRQTRTYSTGGRTITPATGLYTFLMPTAGQAIAFPQGLPTEVSIGGTALATDGLSVALDPTAAVDVSFAIDHDDCTLYQMTLIALVPPVLDTPYWTTENRLGLSGVTPSWKVPRELFTVGENYFFRATCVLGGYPSVAQGDLQTRDLPVSGGYLDSGVFTVAPD